MNHKIIDKKHKQEITELFTNTFTASEGEKEGKLIGTLVSELSSNIDDKENICFGTYVEDLIVGCIFFTRLYFNESIEVYMLAPVAVSTNYQGKGIGQSLIKHGLDELKKRKVSVVVTYGDPAFYSKVGFSALSEDVIKAPHKLSMPFGWLGQSLTDKSIPVINDKPVCVKEFNNPLYW